MPLVNPLEAIDRLVPWESFRGEIEAVVLTPDELKKSGAGRKPFDAILLFRMLVLQALNNLSDEQVEYQVRAGLSFSCFGGLRSRTAFRTPRPYDCSARSWQRLGRSKSCGLGSGCNLVRLPSRWCAASPQLVTSHLILALMICAPRH